MQNSSSGVYCFNTASLSLLLLGLGRIGRYTCDKITKVTKPSGSGHYEVYSYDVDAGALLTLLQLDNLSIRRKKIKAQLMFKILKGNAPSYLKSLFSVRTLEYDVRNNRSKLNIPKPRTNYLKRSICYSGEQG